MELTLKFDHDMTKLPAAELPENALKFDEPESQEALEKIALKFLILSILIIGLVSVFTHS